jgi:hypothetical protein
MSGRRIQAGVESGQRHQLPGPGVPLMLRLPHPTSAASIPGPLGDT